MKELLEKSLKSYFKLRKYKFDSWKQNASETQGLLLDELLLNAQFTEYGRKHSFENISCFDDFVRNVPLSNYSDLKPYIERMRRGECDVLWPGKISFFSKSSGTTSEFSKYIPVSHDLLYENNYEAGRDIYTSYFLNYPDSHLLASGSSILGLGGNFDTETGLESLSGDVSAFIMSQLPVWAEKRREPSIEVALMEKWEEKIPAIISDIEGKKISHITGVPTWYISLFNDLQKKYPNTKLRELLPELELFIHGAVAFGPYKNIFDEFFPGMHYLETYNASEGFFAIQDTKNSDDGMLLLSDHSVFYEFIPMSVFETKDQFSLPLSFVELGKNYAIIITTSSGLWRYCLGDTVEFTSIDPYRIKITGRTKHFINVFGEELMVGDTDKALSSLLEKHSAQLADYTIAPIFMNAKGKGGHEWLIQWKKEPSDKVLFNKDLDLALKSINSDYAAKRQNDIALQAPTVHHTTDAIFTHWLENKKGKLGGQIKIPRLSNKRTTLEEVKEYLK